MGEKRRWGNWDRGNCDDCERWPKSSRRWGQQNQSGNGYNAWRKEPVLSKSESNGRGYNAWREEPVLSKSESNGWGDFYSSVPSWVRTFCTHVCRVPWKKICDARRMMFVYKNIAEWDDSAGQEAFENAKVRYWSRINHRPCELRLPDPYMYIDKVNFDTFIDPELAEDLERSAFDPDANNKPVINHSETVPTEPVPATGWVDARHSSGNWDKYVEKPSSGWDSEIAECDPWERRRNQSIDVNGRDSSWKKQASWKDQEDAWKHQERWKDQEYSWEHQERRKDQEHSWEHQERWKNVEDGRNSGLNYMNLRYQMADSQMSRSCKANNSFQKKVQPQGAWQRSQFWGSRNHQRTGYSSAPWQRENAVS